MNLDDQLNYLERGNRLNRAALTLNVILLLAVGGMVVFSLVTHSESEEPVCERCEKLDEEVNALERQLHLQIKQKLFARNELKPVREELKQVREELEACLIRERYNTK